MNFSKYLKKLSKEEPAAALVAEERETQKCRPSDLPIYVPEPSPPPPQEPQTNMAETEPITFRRQVTSFLNEVKAYQKVGMEYYQQGKETTEWVINYLREEDNTAPRIGAIALGGLAGLIFALRGRLFKRTFYTATGALGVAAICYPKEAEEYSEIAVAEARKIAVVAYNVANGVEEDEPQLDLPALPEIPSSITEAWDAVVEAASSFISGSETKDQGPEISGEEK